jgi:hypothetical protein
MNINWNKAPKEAQWYQPSTGLVCAAWFYKDEGDGKYYACLENTDDWFQEAWQENCKEWQWTARPNMEAEK